MAKNKSGGALIRPPGQVTDLERIEDPVIIGNDGSIRIDSSRLAAPHNIYDADLLWAKRRRGAVSLFFGKEDLQNPGRLRSRLEVRIDPISFYHHLWKNAREFHERLSGFLAKTPPALGDDRPNPDVMLAEKDHSDWANVDSLSHSGHHACLDFFNLSPAGLARFAKGNGTAGLILAPVVRVQTTARELQLLLTDWDGIAGELAREGIVEATQE